MRRLALTVAALALAVAGRAQAPTMSGQWTVEPSAPQCKGGAGASGLGGGCGESGAAKVLCGDTLTIEVTTDAIEVERLVMGEPKKMMFPLDGSATKHVMPYCRVSQPTGRLKELINAELAIRSERLASEGLDDKMTTAATRDGGTIVLRSSVSTP